MIYEGSWNLERGSKPSKRVDFAVNNTKNVFKIKKREESIKLAYT